MLALLVVAGCSSCSCSKAAGNQDPVKSSKPDERVSVPGAKVGGAEQASKGGEELYRLKPEEGQLAIEVPPDAKAGAETIAKVTVTPSAKFKINFEYPTKLTLETPAGVTLAKAKFEAGGADQGKGDADKFEEKLLTFAVKLTPTAGSHTINGSFKFAVCDKDQCLPKKESITFQVAAK